MLMAGSDEDMYIKDEMMKPLLQICNLSAVISAGLIMGACAPTVKIQAPDRPIEINLNIKIDQEVRVRLEKDVEDFIANNPDIF